MVGIANESRGRTVGRYRRWWSEGVLWGGLMGCCGMMGYDEGGGYQSVNCGCDGLVGSNGILPAGC